jgi:succinate dehydrogenase/fumarate reductase cytochrome b subunit
MAKGRVRSFRAYHRASAVLLGLFLAIHLINHIVALTGQAEHIAFMRAVRPLYRNAIIESLLLVLFAWQITSGVIMIWRGWKARHGAVAWLQAGSGSYLAIFITVHILSVLSGRLVLHLDTDFRFAAAGFHVPGWPWYFWPYYALAVFSLFAHIGCAIYWNVLGRNRRVADLVLGGMVVMGAALGLLIVSALAGQLYPVEIPTVYKATYSGVQRR